MFFNYITTFYLIVNLLLKVNGLPWSKTDSTLESVPINVPNGQTVDEYKKSMSDFWTDERINAAVPKPLINDEPILTAASTDANDGRRAPIDILGTLPTSILTSKRAGYPNTVGKVYFVDGSSYYSCSASVVTADNKDLIITAGHCVYSTTSNAYVTSFVFIPNYDNSSSPTRPYGTWSARHIYALSNWVSYGDLNSDVAAVLLYTLNNQHIQDVVGSQGIRFYSSHSAAVNSFGYPVNYANGQIMTYCNGTKYFGNFSTYTGDALPCTMLQGCSGGPWLESFSFSTLRGTQTSVNSFTRSSVPNVMYGPYFGVSIEYLYNTAKVNQGTSMYSGITQWFFCRNLLLFCVLLYFQNLLFA